MTTITVEIPDEVAAKIDPTTLSMLLQELVEQKVAQPEADAESSRPLRPLYREITDFLAANPTPQQIVTFKITAAAQDRLETLLAKQREAALSPGEKAELDTYLHLSEWLTTLKARARSGQQLLG